MVFIAIHDKLRRLRVNGEATVRDEDSQSAGNFSELSAPHPYHANGRAADRCAATWR